MGHRSSGIETHKNQCDQKINARYIFGAYTHRPFAPGPTLYYALVHEFGRSAVEEAFEKLN